MKNFIKKLWMYHGLGLVFTLVFSLFGVWFVINEDEGQYGWIIFSLGLVLFFWILADSIHTLKKNK